MLASVLSSEQAGACLVWPPLCTGKEGSVGSEGSLESRACACVRSCTCDNGNPGVHSTMQRSEDCSGVHVASILRVSSLSWRYGSYCVVSPSWPRTHGRQDLLSSTCLHQVNWPMSFQGFSCLHHLWCCPGYQSTEVHDHAQFYMGPGALNSGPHACVSISNALPLSHLPSLWCLLLMQWLRSPFWPLEDVLGPGVTKQRNMGHRQPLCLYYSGRP